ncbi:LPS-assembly protein LptD [Arsenophonus endosymbiont of Bemisia tabaci Q2]|nr:LPS-assembly protein LptD [Arsenophonus endosymbiont of Bemisia tabaci Q2]
MMKKSHPTLLATMIWIAVHSQQAHPDLTEQCMLGVPVYTKPIVKGNPNDLPTHITAKDVAVEYPHFIEYKGNVDIQQGNQTLTADEVKLTQTETTSKNPLRTVVATGNVHYDDPQIILKGLKAWSNLSNKDTDVEKGDYLMVGRQGRGCANKMKLRGENRYTILEKGMFTACLPGNDSWSVVGSEVILDRQEQVAEIWNARFRIGNVPVFYSPYLQLPIGNKRGSGFLLPNGSYSKGSGLDFALPFYWNIAPNYDATITAQFMTFRGVKLNNEFRYLTIARTGTVAVDWLKHERNYIKDKNSGHYPARDSDDRWLVYWGHSGVLNQVWRFNIDYTKVSDPKYFTDFTSKYGNSTDGYATQKFSVGYAQPNWNATLTHKQFQVFVDSPNSKAYKTEPQLDLNFYKYDLGPFDLKTYTQAARITSVGANNPDATRLHIEPELNLPLANDWASINNTVRLLATYYDQDIPDKLANGTLKKHVTRVLPSVTSDAKLVFERDLLKNSNYVQTLEPRVQYLYIPYRDQSDINNYDSSLLQADYNGLFRNRIYSGLDRIASANQLTTGITTRIYDEELTERFNFSVGQIYYFERPRTEDSDLQIEDKSNTGSLLWAGDTYLRLTDNGGLRGGIQYDRRLGDITMGNVVTEYRLDSDRLIQLNYRFVDRDYIQATVRSAPAFQKGISQMGVVVSWPLGDRWGFVGSYYHDLKEKQPASRLIGLQYSTCCWSINMGYERKIVGWQPQNFNSDYDNRWSINVELRGLNNNHNLGSQDMLASGILPYQQAF